MDVAKKFVQALAEGNRQMVESLLGEDKRHIDMIYSSPQTQIFLREVYDHIMYWKQDYYAGGGDSSVHIVYRVGDQGYVGGFEMSVANLEVSTGRIWIIRLFY